MFKKVSKMLLPMSVTLFLSMPAAFAETPSDSSGTAQPDPAKGAFGHVDLVNKAPGGTVSTNEIYNDLNSIVELVFYGAGFFSLIALIVASVLLATSGHNPQRRSAGFGALGMALLGGWILYKSSSIAMWLNSFGTHT